MSRPFTLLPLLPLVSLLACTSPPEASPPPTPDPEANAERCAQLDEAACRADAECWPIEAQRLDPEAEPACLEVRSFTGCAPSGLLCTAAEVPARHAEGDCWLFSSGCLPATSWTADESCRAPGSGWPRCDAG